MTIMDADSLRRLFEDWASCQGTDPQAIERERGPGPAADGKWPQTAEDARPLGEYVLWETERAWMHWQRCARALAAAAGDNPATTAATDESARRIPVAETIEFVEVMACVAERHGLLSELEAFLAKLEAACTPHVTAIDRVIVQQLAAAPEEKHG